MQSEEPVEEDASEPAKDDTSEVAESEVASEELTYENKPMTVTVEGAYSKNENATVWAREYSRPLSEYNSFTLTIDLDKAFEGMYDDPLIEEENRGNVIATLGVVGYDSEGKRIELYADQVYLWKSDVSVDCDIEGKDIMTIAPAISYKGLEVKEYGIDLHK